MDLAAKMKQVWETTATRNAHLGLDGEEELMLARFKNLVTDRMSVKDKIVVDFGMGGALLGKHLFSLEPPKRRPRLYVGYDIAERSMKRAEENLKDHLDKTRLILIRKHVWSFAEQNPDIIVCLACIFHFPTKIYLDNVLKEMDRSGARRLVLEIRNTGKGTQFQTDPYSTSKKTLLACSTTPDYVAKLLPSYALAEKTEPDPKTGSQVLWFECSSAVSVGK